MHILYVHQNFPAQFGHIAAVLAKQPKWRCTYVSSTPAGNVNGIEKIVYTLEGGASLKTHFCSRTFENCTWHCDAIYQAMKARPDIVPDLIVGHSGFGSTLFLRELYPRVPVINLFELFYRVHGPDSDMEFRQDLGWEVPQINFIRARARMAMTLLDLHNCQIGYSPTQFQRASIPREYQHKMRMIFDGVDRATYHGHSESLRPPVSQRAARTLAGVQVEANQPILTYVSRGFESTRGFDIFMRSAKIIVEQNPDVQIIVVGEDKIAYSGDAVHVGEDKTFRQWVLEQQEYDLSRIHFVGRLSTQDLAILLASTDLHMYLTAPFVLSWSMMDAMSCGAVVLGSSTSPVREMIHDGENGLLADFFKPEEFAEKALQVLKDPDQYRPLGRAAEKMIAGHYSLDVVMPRMVRMYEDAAQMLSSDNPPPIARPLDNLGQPDELLAALPRQLPNPFRG